MAEENNNTPPATPPAAPDQATQQRIAELEAQLKETQEFVDNASILISAIYKNEPLKQQVQGAVNAAISGQPYTPPAPTPPPAPQAPQAPQPRFDPYTGQPLTPPQAPPAPTPPPTPQPDGRVTGMDVKMRQDIVQRVEGRLGLTSLKEEDRKKLRGQVERKLNEWGGSVMTIPVAQLEKSLTDAYVITDMPRAKEQGRAEGYIQAMTTNQAAIPSMSNTPTEQEESVNLTAQHKDWAKKLGVSEDKVAANLKELTETGRVAYKPKDQTPNTSSQPTPSSTPTPPQQPQNSAAQN